MEDRGMYCPANGCHSFLRTYSLCWKNWAEVHEKIVTMCSCETIQECSFTSTRRNQVVCHIWKSRPSKQNKGYKDLGSGLLPLQPVTEAINRYRTMQAERRRLQASSKITWSLESGTNARDHEVIVDGQNCFVVTSRLWGPASQKTITKV